MTFKPRSEGSRDWGKTIPGSRSRKCKGPEAPKDSSQDWCKEKRRKEVDETWEAGRHLWVRVRPMDFILCVMESH